MRVLLSFLLLGVLCQTAAAQVVSVEVRFETPGAVTSRSVCGPQGCQVIRARGEPVTTINRGSGVIVGKSKSGHTLVLSCGHTLRGPAGSKWVANYVDGVNASVTRIGQGDDDLSLLWTEKPLSGKPFSLAETDPQIGQELAVAGFDAGKTDKPAYRVAPVKRKNVLAVAVKDGNSGGPVIGKGQKVYGIVWGYTSPTRENPNPNESYFTPVSRIREFLRTPKPIEGISLAFHEEHAPSQPQRAQTTFECPPCPPCPPFGGFPGFGGEYPTTGPVLPPLSGVLPPLVPDNSLPGGSAPIVTDNLTIISPNVNLVPMTPDIPVPTPTPTTMSFDPSVHRRLAFLEFYLRNVDGRVRRLEANRQFGFWNWNWWIRLHLAERRLNNLDLRVCALEYRGY